ncbi:hypothetical protein AB1Y20_020230 [Prymnesium parvum]|uniref:MAM domain-containing protein n=1 Tax=Prymnesium parvum TaxID=97485 RepID=A0AB34IF63_PRYPA
MRWSCVLLLVLASCECERIAHAPDAPFFTSVASHTQGAVLRSLQSVLEAIHYYEGFEDSTFSPGWSTGNSAFSWSRREGPTPTFGTGPVNAKEGLYYMYTESSAPRAEGDLFDLSFTCPLSDRVHQVTWWYHMRGDGVGTLRLTNGQDVDAIAWNRSGDVSSEWQEATVELAWSGPQVVFEGVRGSNWNSDISIDDVAATRRCSSNQDEQPAGHSAAHFR